MLSMKHPENKYLKPQGLWRCTDCNLIKPLEEYPKRYDKKRYPESARQSKCKSCTWQAKKAKINKNPKEKRKVYIRNETRKAIKRGRLVKTPCEVCEDKRVEAHHEDYTKVLEVRWLCRPCHMEAHDEEEVGLTEPTPRV